MNYNPLILAASAVAMTLAGGCTTYPETYYDAAGRPVYVAPTTTTVVDYYPEPYYYRHPHVPPPVIHHVHGSGPQHGYGMGPIMPPRGAGPHVRHPYGPQAKAIQHAAASQSKAFQHAAKSQSKAAQHAAKAQSKAASKAMKHARP